LLEWSFHFDMASVKLVHPEETFEVALRGVVTHCDLFSTSPALLTIPSTVRSSVRADTFRDFIAALEGKAVEITNENFRGLSLLCSEFGFQALSAKLGDFRASPAFRAMQPIEDSEAGLRLAELEVREVQRQRDIAGLQCDLARQSHELSAALARVSRLEAEVTDLRSASEPGRKLTSEIRELRAENLALKSAPRVPAAPAPQTNSIASPISTPNAAPVPPPPPVRFDSLIVSEFPEIFAEFSGKRFSLLWRGSRDGFGADDFHSRCNGHANTLTVILDTDGNVFGGFTPLEWESREWNRGYGNEDSRCKADGSLRSFLFTLKNPHNIPVRRFALQAGEKGLAIDCGSRSGPCFGYDIVVSDNCNANTRSRTLLGTVYTNDTGLHWNTVFTGSRYFQVMDIEVFEITE
jgi:hypothetical protein